MAIEIKASFTKDTRPLNGLELIVEDLMDKPLAEVYAIVKVRCATTKVDHLNGDKRTAVIVFPHIEPMLSDEEEQAAKRLFEQAARARLGELPQQSLPFEGEPGDADGADDTA